MSKTTQQVSGRARIFKEAVPEILLLLCAILNLNGFLILYITPENVLPSRYVIGKSDYQLLLWNAPGGCPDIANSLTASNCTIKVLFTCITSYLL